jgi:hypothetical protein
VKVGVASRKGRHARAGPRDEVVVDDVRVALAVTIAGDIAAATTPVIDDLMMVRGKLSAKKTPSEASYKERFKVR